MTDLADPLDPFLEMPEAARRCDRSLMPSPPKKLRAPACKAALLDHTGKALGLEFGETLLICFEYYLGHAMSQAVELRNH